MGISIEGFVSLALASFGFVRTIRPGDGTGPADDAPLQRAARLYPTYAAAANDSLRHRCCRSTSDPTTTKFAMLNTTPDPNAGS